MILTVTLNAAMDLTYDVPQVIPHASHRVTQVRQRAGGKGINVASVLSGLDCPTFATGLAGGAVGGEIRTDLDRRGIPHRFAPCTGESRRTLNVVSADAGDATIFNEAGPEISPAEWDDFLDLVAVLLDETGAQVVVASGSLPRGVPADAYAQIVRLARGHGVLSVVDADGEPLLQALAAGPDVVKPNRHELLAVTGLDDPLAGAAALRARGARTVVASAGADGVVVSPREGPSYRAWLDQPLRGNPTGAGDAMVAAVAAGLARAGAWPGTLVGAVAWSAAAVMQPVAGHVDSGDIAHLSPLVRIKEINGSRTS